MKRYDKPLTLEEIGEVKGEDIDFSDIPELGEDLPLTLEEIGEIKGEDIDFSDIPELGEDFWKNAEVVELDHPAKQDALRRGLSFPERMPNAETREAMRQIATGDGLIRCDGVKGMIAECDDE